MARTFGGERCDGSAVRVAAFSSRPDGTTCAAGVVGDGGSAWALSDETSSLRARALKRDDGDTSAVRAWAIDERLEGPPIACVVCRARGVNNPQPMQPLRRCVCYVSRADKPRGGNGGGRNGWRRQMEASWEACAMYGGPNPKAAAAVCTVRMVFSEKRAKHEGRGREAF